MIWKGYFLLLTIFSIALLYPFFYFWLNDEKHFKKGFRLMRIQAGFLLFMSGIRYKIDRRFVPERGQGYVICPNHTSYLDILLLYRIFPDYFIFMGKQELAEVPLFNIYFKKMNILVNRRSRVASHRAFVRASREIDKGRNIVIFPEGTIPSFTPRLKHFKNGAFKLALNKQIPVIPVTFLNNYKLLEDTRKLTLRARPGLSKIVVHPPVHTKGKNEHDLVDLRNEVYAILEDTLKKEKDYHKFVSHESK